MPQDKLLKSPVPTVVVVPHSNGVWSITFARGFRLECSPPLGGSGRCTPVGRSDLWPSCGRFVVLQLCKLLRPNLLLDVALGKRAVAGGCLVVEFGVAGWTIIGHIITLIKRE